MARSTASKTNVVAPGGDYPYGRVKDNLGSNNGTPVNEVLVGDYVQFFERLMAVAGASFNGQPDNNSAGFQLFTALQTVIQSFIDSLKGGVPTAGDTLNKLYNLITALGRPRGGWDASSNTVPGSASNEDGDFWRITVQGTLSGLASGAGVVRAGDVIIAIGDGATAQSSFYAIQSNVDQATNTVLGLVKLYTDISNSNTDGGITQSAAKANFDGKLAAGNVAPDNTTVEVATGTLKVKDAGLTGKHVQAYSVTGSKIAKSSEDNDANTFIDPGVFYGHGGASTNLPNNSQRYSIVVVRQGAFGSNIIYQVATQLDGAGIGDIYIRSSVDSTPSSWNAWVSVNT